jgi:hypothetical protein
VRLQIILQYSEVKNADYNEFIFEFKNQMHME